MRRGCCCSAGCFPEHWRARRAPWTVAWACGQAVGAVGRSVAHFPHRPGTPRRPEWPRVPTAAARTALQLIDLVELRDLVRLPWVGAVDSMGGGWQPVRQWCAPSCVAVQREPLTRCCAPHDQAMRRSFRTFACGSPVSGLPRPPVAPGGGRDFWLFWAEEPAVVHYCGGRLYCAWHVGMEKKRGGRRRRAQSRFMVARCRAHHLLLHPPDPSTTSVRPRAQPLSAPRRDGSGGGFGLMLGIRLLEAVGSLLR